MTKSIQLYTRHRLIFGDITARLMRKQEDGCDIFNDVSCEDLWTEHNNRLHAMAALWFAINEVLPPDALQALKEELWLLEEEGVKMLETAVGDHS